MSRLFISKKEIDFVNDINKEYIKDVIGNQIVYFPISILKSDVHPVYDEAIEKVFDNPIELDVLANQPERQNTFNMFGTEGETEIELFVQARDLIDKGFQLSSGDFFVWGNEVFELISYVRMGNIFGQPEYDTSYRMVGKLARAGEFDIETFKQLLYDAKVFQESQVTKRWQQQRGLEETEINGPTNDNRQVRERLGDEMAHPTLNEDPAKIDLTDDEDANEFYNE